MSDDTERSVGSAGSQPVMAIVSSDEAALRIIVRQQRSEIERLKDAIRRLAEQDATLSVQGGNVTVTMDATLTDEEREAIKMAIAACKVEGELNQACDGRQSFAGLWHDHAGALHGLLKRLG